MGDTTWWQEGVVYQVYPRSFQDSTGDGIGDLAGVTSRLDYLGETLGIDAIWLSPFYRSPMADFGYDVSDHTAVDPIFGDMEDFDRLLSAAHERGIRVIVDYVPNHTSDRHPWFIDARSSRSSGKRDWYVWVDGPDLPNNWLAVFGGPAWEWDEATQQYFLHSYLPEQPDLNWRNPDVEEAMLDVMRFWLDRGVDGFRIDVALTVMKDPDLRDNPMLDKRREHFKDIGPYDLQDHIHDKGHGDVHAVFRKMRAVLDGYQPERFSVGEIHVFDPEELATYYGDGDELHMPFNFSLLHASWNAGTIREIVDRYDAACGDDRWPNYVLGNHDEPRLASRFGERPARAAAVMLLTLRGTPTIYYGDELGMLETDVPEDRRVDPWGLRMEGLSRDGCRTPMQWDGTTGAGFSSAKPWLPLATDSAVRNVEQQLADPESPVQLYRALLRYRRDSPVLRRGAYRSLESSGSIFAYQRSLDGEKALTVAISMGEPGLAEIPAGKIILSSLRDRSGEIVAGHVDLETDEAVVIEALDGSA